MWQPKPTLGWQIQVAAGSQQSVGWTLSGRRLTTPPHVRSSKGVGFAMGGGHPPHLGNGAVWVSDSGTPRSARPKKIGEPNRHKIPFWPLFRQNFVKLFGAKALEGKNWGGGPG